jgi:hypothetical protein
MDADHEGVRLTRPRHTRRAGHSHAAHMDSRINRKLRGASSCVFSNHPSDTARSRRLSGSDILVGAEMVQCLKNSLERCAIPVKRRVRSRDFVD